MKTIQLLIILVSLFLITKFIPAHAQSSLKLTHTRLYIPTSSYTTILKDNDNYYLLAKDYLSSTKAVVNGQGKVENNQSYYPYGTAQQTSDTQPTDKFFTGHRQLDNLNIYHFGARFYSPLTGLFIQPDTVEGPQRYAYAANNPMMNNDPTGHQCKGQMANCFDPGYQLLGKSWETRDRTSKGLPYEAVAFMANLAKFHPLGAAILGAFENVMGTDLYGKPLTTQMAFFNSVGVLGAGGGGEAVGRLGVIEKTELTSNLFDDTADTTMSLIRGTYSGNGGQNRLIIDQADRELQSFANDVNAYVDANRSTYSQSRAPLVEQFVRGRVQYSQAEQQAIYARGGGQARLGQFYSCRVAVCREMAFLNHVGLAAVGKESQIVVGNINGGRHAWTEFIDTVSGRMMVADSAYLGKEGGVVPRDLAYQLYGFVRDLQHYAYARP